MLPAEGGGELLCTCVLFHVGGGLVGVFDSVAWDEL